MILYVCNVMLVASSIYHNHVAERRYPTRLSARAQRDMDLAGVIRAKPVRTPISDKAAPYPPANNRSQFLFAENKVRSNLVSMNPSIFMEP
jgi:hypothetical protein